MKNKHPALAREGDIINAYDDTIFCPDGKTTRTNYEMMSPAIVLEGPFESATFPGYFAWIVLSKDGLGVRYFIKDAHNTSAKLRETHL